ncbi:hypothetical protein ACQF36_37510 [Streptomyces sp. Marseille-Q5077]|uniref:hypothetical protein n=1 Tax=Streptomyces sp. Marseille-Q5077 TaxID=3418995 RepID=UPI003D0941F3
MRFRATTAAATCALAMVVAVPGPASAEILGNFYYTYTDASGAEEQATVEGLPTATCANLPEVADPDTTKPGHFPDNGTEGVAYVYAEIDCRGAKFVLNVDAKGGANMKFRSVYFLAQG